MTRRRLLMIGLPCFVVAIVAFSWWKVLQTDDSISPAKFRQISLGMSRSDLLALLGPPVKSLPEYDLEHQSLPREPLSFKGDRRLLKIGWADDICDEAHLHWIGARFYILAVLRNDRVEAALFARLADVEWTMPERVARWLGMYR